MLILPIVNRRRVLNVELRLKNSEKVRTGVILENTGESEVVVNGKKFTDSSYHNNGNSKYGVVDFIRNASIRNKKDFFITTRENSNSNTYDVYAVSQPYPKINEELDSLYESAITDMRKEIPGIKRGRYVSLEKLGIAKHLTDEKIAMLQEIVKEEKNQNKWPILFAKAGISDLPETLSFVDMFDCQVVSDTTIPEDTIMDTISSLEPLQTRDYRNLKNYYEIAKKNADVYKKLSLINNTLNNKPYTLIQSKRQKEKQKVKVKEKNEVNVKVA
ncbi:MAG: hypothetical protein E7160_00345 [Firmicutes bacterium]|nr:hypothetical protein [Bacillota bacterium]